MASTGVARVGRFAVILCLAGLALPRSLEAGTLYVADRVNNVVAAYNGTTGAVINSSFITGLNNPWFMTRDSDGNFYVTNRNSNAVGKYAPDGTVINASFISASDPMGVAVDNAGRLFLSVGSNVRTYDATTGALINSSFISGLNSPRPLALDGAGNLFVGEYFGSTVGKYDAATGAAVNASLITGFPTPLGLAFDATGKLFVSSVGNPGVQSFDASTGTAISGSRLGGFGGTFGLAFDESNNFFVSRYSDGFMAKLTATGSTVTNPLITLSANGPTSLVYVGAVPEPSTVAMALAGLACGGWSLWRRKRRSRTSGSCVAIAGLLTLMAACGATGSANAAPITIDWVTVGDPGNAADTSGSPSPAGAVAESFKIMKYEFTNSQYATFLNAVDPGGSNPLGLYAGGYGSGVDYRYGIQWQSGASGTHYVVRNNFGDKPVTFVSWFDAARVANWLHNNGAYGSTETGAYTLVGYQTSGTAPARNPGARYFIPTENEWYKAAYYKGGGTNAGYWDYATQSNTAPSAVTADSTGIGSAGSTGNFANYGYGAPWSGGSPNVTTVGTNGGPSAYGAFDMGGNVFELNDLTGGAGSTRGYRGGDFLYSANALAAWGRYTAAPDSQDGYTGFRLAAIVPEPSTVVLALAGIACGGFSLWRRKRARLPVTLLPASSL